MLLMETKIVHVNFPSLWIENKHKHNLPIPETMVLRCMLVAPPIFKLEREFVRKSIYLNCMLKRIRIMNWNLVLIEADSAFSVGLD